MVSTKSGIPSGGRTKPLSPASRLSKVFHLKGCAPKRQFMSSDRFWSHCLVLSKLSGVMLKATCSFDGFLKRLNYLVTSDQEEDPSSSPSFRLLLLSFVVSKCSDRFVAVPSLQLLHTQCPSLPPLPHLPGSLLLLPRHKYVPLTLIFGLSPTYFHTTPHVIFSYTCVCVYVRAGACPGRSEQPDPLGVWSFGWIS